MKIFSTKINIMFNWVLLSLLLYAGTSLADVKKTIQIISQPAGAEVFLVRGRKETSIGKTPMKYKASFHSEKSILRLKLHRAGFDDKIIKVKATDKEVSVNLKSFQYTASPQDYKDKKLREAQKKINPVVKRFLPKLIEKQGHFKYRMNGPVKTVSFGGKPYAALPINLERLEGKSSKGGKDRKIELLRKLWKEFGDDLVMPLAGHLKNKGVAGLILRISFDDQKFLFNVSSHIETKTEMVCVGGYEQIRTYNSCKFYDSSRGGCIGGTDFQSVYNPCLNRVPRVKSKVVLDPKAGTTKGKALASFLVPVKKFSSKTVPFEQVPYILIDSKGKILSSQGKVVR